MVAFLLDTNVLSEALYPRPEPKVLEFLRATPDLWLSAISLHEFAYGAARAEPARRAKLEAWIAGIRHQFSERIIDVDAEVCDRAGRMRAGAEAVGRQVDALDCLIAASCAERGLTLATRNTRDFDALGIPLFNPWRD